MKQIKKPFTNGYIKYEKIKTYKYRLLETYVVRTPIVGYRCSGPFSDLYEDGLMVLWKGYACDGPSGPTFDSKTFMRGAFGHDDFFQFLRSGCLPQSEFNPANKFLHQNCREDGMWSVRARWVLAGVRTLWGKLAARVRPKPKPLYAPKFIEENRNKMP